MPQNIKLSIDRLEKIIISNKDRYKLNVTEKGEIKKKLFNQVILIVGACGSIGKKFTKQIYEMGRSKEGGVIRPVQPGGLLFGVF